MKEISLWRASTNTKIEQAAYDIVSDVEKNKEKALLKYAYGLVIAIQYYAICWGKMPCKKYDRITDGTRSLLDRSAKRVMEFAQGQKIH